LRIEIVAGTGFGPTQLAAFDAAETGMGLSNSNLIQLSSVIPPGAKVEELEGATTLAGNWGDRVYAVLADNRISRQGAEIWAGIGWFMVEGSDKGLFAEHIGDSRQSVESQIRDSLLGFMKNRGLKPDDSLIQMQVTGTTCQDQSACVLVAAVYQSQSWA
jgi:arginine decarboxylase